MARKQTRRALSVKGLTYQRLKKYCDAKGMSVSGFVEEIVHERLDELGVPVEAVLEPRPLPRPEKKAGEISLGDFKGSTFTF